MADKEGKSAPQILDEMWTLMRYAIVTKENTQESSDDFLKVMPDHFRWECVVADSDESSCDTESNDSTLKSDSSHDDGTIHEAADLLAEIGDTYCTEKDAQARLVTEITEYLRPLSNKIDEKLGGILGSTRPPNNLFQTSVFSAAYSIFKTKLLGFLGVDESIDRIAVVTHIARGVAAGFENSDQQTLYLISALAYKFVSDRYDHTLAKYDSVKSLAESAKEPKHEAK